MVTYNVSVMTDEIVEPIQSDNELDLENGFFQDLEDLIEIPEDELIEALPEGELPDDLADALGQLFHEIRRQPLLSREDEFRLFVLIQAGRKLHDNLSRWEGLYKPDEITNAILNIYQNTSETWDKLQSCCESAEIPKPELGDIFSEIFLQRILGQPYYSISLAEWFEFLPPDGELREQMGGLALEIPISIMLLPVTVITWLSGCLARDDQKFPPLSDLANWLIQTDDIEFDIDELTEISQNAREKMILSNLRLVIWAAKHYQGRGVELEDLVQAGSMGLLRAIKKFSPVKGYKFSTYATWWVRQAVTRYIADNSRLIRLPVHFHDKLFHILKIRDQLVQELRRKPTPEEIAKQDPDLTAEKVQMALMVSREPLSLDMKSRHDDEDSVFGDFIPDNDLDLTLTIEKNNLREILERAMDCLPARERKILALRYGFDDGKVSYAGRGR